MDLREIKDFLQAFTATQTSFVQKSIGWLSKCNTWSRINRDLGRDFLQKSRPKSETTVKKNLRDVKSCYRKRQSDPAARWTLSCAFGYPDHLKDDRDAPAPILMGADR